MKFLFEGCEYMMVVSREGSKAIITVKDADNDAVGSVHIDANIELSYSVNEDDGLQFVNYFTFSEMADLEIAKWIVATNY